MRITKTHILFWKGILSNWANTPYNHKGMAWANSEQHYMWLKAKFFRDEETADAIRQTSNPKEVKWLGRQVRGYDDKLWAKVREDMMYQACLAKFTGNKKAREYMLSLPKDCHFAEASPFDIIWGIGWEENHPNALAPGMWRGQNLLGNCLNRVRAELLYGKKKTSLF